MMMAANSANQLVLGRAVALGTITVTDSSGNTTDKHMAVVVGSGKMGTSGIVPVLGVIDVSQTYTPGQPLSPQLLGLLQLPLSAGDVKLNDGIAYVATGSDVLIMSIGSPSQPTLVGKVTGTFGNWITLTQNNFLVNTSSTAPGNRLTTTPLETIAFVNTYRPNPIPLTLPSPPQSNSNLTALLEDVLLSHVIVPPDPAVTSDRVDIMDDLGNTTVSFSGSLSGGQGTVTWPKGSVVDSTRTYSAQVYAVKDGIPLSTFPVQLSFAGPAIQVTRTSLKMTSSVGTPTPGGNPAFTYTTTLVTGSLTAAYSTTDPNTNPNIGNITAPSNPTGVPTPGGLANLKVCYTTLAGGQASKSFFVPTFGLSCYMLVSTRTRFPRVLQD